MNLVEVVNKNHMSPNAEKFPDFKTGDTVAVHYKIKEGDKERIQVYEGTVIAKKGTTKNVQGHFRVRKMSAGGVGVERVFPYHSPAVEKIEVRQKGRIGRSKFYYLRERTGKSARVDIDFTRD